MQPDIYTNWNKGTLQTRASGDRVLKENKSSQLFFSLDLLHPSAWFKHIVFRYKEHRKELSAALSATLPSIKFEPCLLLALTVSPLAQAAHSWWHVLWAGTSWRRSRARGRSWTGSHLSLSTSHRSPAAGEGEKERIILFYFYFILLRRKKMVYGVMVSSNSKWMTPEKIIFHFNSLFHWVPGTWSFFNYGS